MKETDSVSQTRQHSNETKKLVSFKSVCMVKKRCIGGGGHDLFRKGISHKEIPRSFGVAKNSGSAPPNF